MMRWIAVFALWIVIALFVSSASGLEKDCFKLLSDDDLVCRSEFCPGIFHAGGGVDFRLAPGLSPQKLTGPPVTWMNIAVMDGDTPIRHLPDSFYIGYGHLAQGEAHFWMIGEYTGGVHCCSRYHFFSRPTAGQRLIYIGTTAESAQGLDEEPFSCRDNHIFLEDWESRFLYFHTPYAQSVLLFPTHYKLTPSSLAIDNTPFRDKYLELAKAVDTDIETTVSKRTSRPAAIIPGKDKDAFFSDELGQLLVKRTILYLYAREEKKAWKTLERDVIKHYRQTSGLTQIQKEIRKLLAEGPY